MKPVLYLLVILLVPFSTVSTVAQTIRRVNNSPGITGLNVYTTIQDAHDAAANGDIIYVEPSGQSYGSLTCSKRLTIIGNGYLLDQNPNTSVDKVSAYLNALVFGPGSASSIAIGLSVTSPGATMGGNSITVADANITITRCIVGGVTLQHYNATNVPYNVTISKCLLYGGIGYGGGPGSGYSIATGATINNNIFNTGGGAAISNLFNATIINNTIFSVLNGTGSTPPIAAIQNVANSTITNNIIDLRNAAADKSAVGTTNQTTFKNNTISNNICLDKSGLPADNGNVNAASATGTFRIANPWFLDYFNRAYYEQDATFQLAASSPAKGIGTGGTDAGAFGGASPYVLSGQPNVPIITNFTTSGSGNSSTPLTVTISVRSNN